MTATMLQAALIDLIGGEDFSLYEDQWKRAIVENPQRLQEAMRLLEQALRRTEKPIRSRSGWLWNTYRGSERNDVARTEVRR